MCLKNFKLKSRHSLEILSNCRFNELYDTHSCLLSDRLILQPKIQFLREHYLFCLRFYGYRKFDSVSLFCLMMCATVSCFILLEDTILF